MILDSCHTAVQHYFESKDPAEIWNALRSAFSPLVSASDARALRNQFTTETFDNYESIASYAGKLQPYQTQSLATRYAVTDNNFIHQLTYSLPPSFDTTIEMLESQVHSSFAHTINTLIRKEERLEERKHRDAGSLQGKENKNVKCRPQQ